MTQLATLFTTHLKLTFREKQVWFWSIFYPVILLVIFGFIFGKVNDGTNFEAKVAIVQDVPNQVSSQLLQILSHIPQLELDGDASISQAIALEKLKQKKVDAVIVLPEHEQVGTIQIWLHQEKMQTTTTQAIKGIVESVAQHMNWSIANVQPTISVQTNTVSVGKDDLKYSAFLLTGLIALSISQSGLFNMVQHIELQRTGLLRRLRMTPMSMITFSTASILVKWVLALIQIVLLTIAGMWLFDAALYVDLLGLLFIFTVGTLSFAAMGYFLVSLSKSMEMYIGLANLASFLMMFISGIFFDVNMLPEFMQSLSHHVPLTYFANGIRDTMLYEMSLSNGALWNNVFVLVLWGAGAMIAASLIMKRKNLK
ncbi:ABC transporter permease [Paenibacillus sp. SC116]|uniref:ABC transporter permease n=1 Tax=Paenibacillus sp. SC116 TaxID=2968986 RepID=UPI00215A2A9F|nr:ABC transporter permease [Paenibacillus sp. SC116]MCR8845707.1 ABC transporter permease [Paenibacillus sp. SC116]